MARVQRKEITVQVEEDYLESFGFGSAGFLRHNGLDVKFLSGVNWATDIDTTSPRSRDQRIDELAYSIIYGEEAPTTPVRKTRRSRSEEPRRVNQESLTLEDRMGPKARFRVRSNGWRPLRSISEKGEGREGLPPTPPQEALAVREVAECVSQGISAEHASMSGSVPMTTNSFCPDRSPTAASCRSQGSDMLAWAVPTPPRKQSSAHEYYCCPPQVHSEAPTSPTNQSSVPARSFTGETHEVPAQLASDGSFTTQPVWAWRYGRGSWHSVRGCTVELQHATITVRREGAVQQALPVVSVAQAITYGSLGRLILVAAPGVDSLFLSLDKPVQSLLVRALAFYGISVCTAGYGEFFALQKQLVFPGAPLFEPPPSPVPVKKAVVAKPEVDVKMQAELNEQLSALRAQQEQLARLEAQLLQLQTGAR